MNISHISISRKSVWDQCQNQYKYKYHLKIPNPNPEPEFFAYGKLVHKIAEEYIIHKGERQLGVIAADVLSGKISIERDKNGNHIKAPPLSKEYRNKLPEHLNSIKKLTDKIGCEGVTEWEFKYDLDPPHGRFVTGFIDRIIRKGDNFFILDYKTSKKNFYRKNRRTVTKDMQLRTYARVIQREYNVPAKNIRTALYYLEGAELIGAIFSEESLASVEGELLDIYKQIEGTPEEKAWGNVGDWCSRCDYRKLCPFYRMH